MAWGALARLIKAPLHNGEFYITFAMKHLLLKINNFY
jgi:hypothetical protein